MQENLPRGTSEPWETLWVRYVASLVMLSVLYILFFKYQKYIFFEFNSEARRDGVPSIELVDGEKLIEMFEALGLGLKPKKDFEVDSEFFKEFYH